MLRRGEVKEVAKEEVERREDEVEDSLEGWKEEQEEGCAAKSLSGQESWGIIVEV